ncbi:MAG TPA: kynureninase [Actinocrinis sp.]|nr:kynureninase [Actinocrinis sp.]
MYDTTTEPEPDTEPGLEVLSVPESARPPMPTRADCAALDAADPLAALRDEFDLPAGVLYLDGNSLGALPRRTSARVRDLVEREWGQGLIRSWNGADWYPMPHTLGESVAALLGAAPGQTVICDSVSVNLFKVLISSLRLRPGRRTIVSELAGFPTDLYITEGVSGLFDGSRQRLVGRDGEDLEELLDSDVAVVLLSHVDYRTGRLHDMAAVTEQVHRHGALMVWDLCHSAGALPIQLDECEVDFAVGCTYKYLNAGPGAPAFLYAAARHQDSASHPLLGWSGHADPFAFEPGYTPAPGVGRFLAGTPPMLSFAGLQASLELWAGVDLGQVRAKSVALGELFIRGAEELGLELASPRDPAQRGSHVSFRHPHGFAVVQALIERGVIGDFRTPDIMRFGLTPLYLGYRDVWDAVRILGEILAEETWREPRFSVRGIVT